MNKKIKWLSLAICVLFISTAFSGTIGAMNEKAWGKDTLKELTQNDASISVEITKPRQGYLYINDREIIPLFLITLIIGPIIVETSIDSDNPIERIEFYIDDELKHTDYYEPYIWECDEILSRRHILKVKAYDYSENTTEKELSAWMFNTRTLSDAPPIPMVTEPANTGLLLDPQWETTIVHGPIEVKIGEPEQVVLIQAGEFYLAEDIVSTLFEYSTDGNNWITIGTDEYGGFDGVFLPSGMNCKAGSEGWSIGWDISNLTEGFYYLRATMTDEEGQTGEDVRKIYLDPMPPIPNIVRPNYGSIVSGIVPFEAVTAAENIVSMELKLFQDSSFQCKQDSTQDNKGQSGWYNQTGLGNTRQGEVGPPYRGVNRFCFPTATANALAGQNDNRLYPPGKTGNNTAMAKELKKKLKTRDSSGTTTRHWNVPDLEHGRSDFATSRLRQFLNQQNAGCENDTGYTVTVYKTNFSTPGNRWIPTSTMVDWDDFDSEIRNKEAVIIDIAPWEPGKDGKMGTNDDDTGGGHALTGRGSNNKANKDGSHDVSLVDPHTGKPFTTQWRTNNRGFSEIKYNGKWYVVLAIWAISPKKKDTSHVYFDSSLGDGWIAYWDTTTVEDGFYTLIVEITDSNGFVGRDSIVVEVDNTPEDNEPPLVVITSPDNNTVFPVPHVNIIGYASDTGSGIVCMEYLWEWNGGSTSDNFTYDPPRSQVSFRIEIMALYEGWNRITATAEDATGNQGSDSVVIFHEPGGEDIIPPVTIKEIGEPNWEGGYAIMDYTPIWLYATDNPGGSGVAYIYYEVWWDSNVNEIIDPDELVGYMITDGDTVEIHFEDWDLDYTLSHLVGLGWYAVDNAENKEAMHYQEHFVMVD